MGQIPECPHGGDYYACPPCQRDAGHGAFTQPAKRLTSESASFGARTNARFKSQCPRCRGLINLSERIVMTEDGWVHEESCALDG